MNFRDDIERDFWISVYTTEHARARASGCMGFASASIADAAVEALRERAPLIPDPMGLTPDVYVAHEQAKALGYGAEHAAELRKRLHVFDFAEWWEFEAPWDHRDKRSAAEYAWLSSETNTAERIARIFDNLPSRLIDASAVAARIREFT